MIGTNKTIIGITLGVFALTILVGGARFAAATKSVPITTVTPVVTTAPIAQPKFENFDPAKYTGETGKIVLPLNGDRASVTLRKWVDDQLGDYLQVSGQSSELTVPVGSYKLQYYYVRIAGKDGRNWSIGSSRVVDDKSPIIEVKANESVELGTAKQLQAAIESGKTGSIKLPCEGQASLSLQLAGDDKFPTSLQVSGKGSELAVPVGTYKLGFYYMSVSNKNGQNWSINNAPLPTEKARVLEVKSGGSVNLVSGGQLAASMKSGKTGTITLPYEGQSTLRLRFIDKGRPGDYLSMSSKESKLSIPTGQYKLESFNCTVAGKDDAKWMISSSTASEQTAKTLNIKSGADTKVTLGQPLTASIDVKQDGDKMNLSMQIVAGNGENYTIRRAEGIADPPSFQILSKSGEVLMSGKFAYG